MTARSVIVLALLASACGDDGAGPDGGIAPECVGREPTLECQPGVVADCSGPLSPVDVADPVVECGPLVITSNEPADGFPLGETIVELAGMRADGALASCTTTVTVIDQVAPVVTCEAVVTVVRKSAGEVAAVPAPAASDGCDPDVEVTTPPVAYGRGTHEVPFTATDGSGNVASCTTTLTVVDAFAVTGLRVASAELSGDTTRVTLAWNRTFAADATGYRVEKAFDAAGPWTALGEVAAGTQLWLDTDVAAPRAWYRVVTRAGALDGGVTGPLPAWSIAATSYDLRGQTVATVPFATTLYGVVRHPSDLSGGPYPLVLMLHGNHGICRNTPTSINDFCGTSQDHECPFAGTLTTPNAEGMAYLAETLAAQGIVAVTISGNAMNCREDYILQRTQLLLEHLRRWVTWNGAGAVPFGTTFMGAIDLGRVGFVGHSRGGEAVAHVPDELAATPIAGVTVRGIFAVAPTDYHEPHPDGVPYAVLLPACDGDVWTLSGMRHYDRSVSDGEPRSQVLMTGANHNFYNTEWRNDDNGDEFVCDLADEVGGAAQQAMLEATLGSWFASTLREQPLEGFVRAEGGTPLGISAWAGIDLDLRWSHAAAVRTVIDDFTGVGAPQMNDLGQTNSFVGYGLTDACYQNECSADFDHPRNAMRLDWNGGLAEATFGLGELDASGAEALTFRVTARTSSLNGGAPQDFSVTVADAAGTTATILVGDVQLVPYLYPSNVPRNILQTVRIPLADLVGLAPSLALSRLAELRFSMPGGGPAAGSILITDLDMAE